MASDVERISTDQNRQLIPAAKRRDFDLFTNAELWGMSQDVKCSETARSYARWELAYREAWDIYVDIDPFLGIERHHSIQTDQEAREFKAKLDAEQEQLRCEGEVARAAILARYEAACREFASRAEAEG